MAIIDNLNPIKRKFFESIGIFQDSDIPDTFFEKIKSLNEQLSESEKFCIGDYNVCYSSQMRFCIRDLVGTDHERYAGKTWLEAFLALDRGDKNLQLYFQNPSYYSNLQQGNSDLGLAKKDGKFYILGRAGGGNNRLIIMKIKYLALASRSNNYYDVDESMSFNANVRQVPSRETSDNIFYLVFPNGGYCESGYYAINKSSSSEIEIYDIVSGYPIDTTIIASDILGTDIGIFELKQSHNIKK